MKFCPEYGLNLLNKIKRWTSVLRLSFAFYTLLCSRILVFGQDSLTVRAVILDSKTNAPVPFASVQILQGKKLKWGLISNEDGGIQIPSKFTSEIDSLIISCIGYSRKVVRIDELIGKKSIIIRINPSAIQLQEVVVGAHQRVRLTAKKIVRLAIMSIPQNYPTNPFSYAGYYRDYQRDSDQYINLNEAIVGLLDNGFETDDFTSTKVSLLDYRINKEFRRDSLTAIGYDNNNLSGNKFIPSATVSSFGGNELSILRIHDAIRNYKINSYSFVNMFSIDFLKNHSFKLLGTVLLDDVPLYHITFQALSMITQGRYVAKGEIFVEKGNYAIHKLIYSNNLKDSGKELLLYDVSVEYSRRNSLMYINYISFSNSFKSNTYKGFKVSDVVYDKSVGSFIVSFNHAPEKTSVLDTKNYLFSIYNKPIRIAEVSISNNDDKQVIVKPDNVKDINDVVKPNIKASFENIKDLEGREVNKINYKMVRQFREFFFERLDEPLNEPRADLCVSKVSPLGGNKVDSIGISISKLWMNTPLK